MQNVNTRIAQIESFDVMGVRTFGDLTYILSIMTDVVLGFSDDPHKQNATLTLAKATLVDIINTALEANATGFKNVCLKNKLAVEFSTFAHYLKLSQS